MLLLPIRSEIRVRFAEMDPYGHVNHSMYLTYLEQGRAEALEHADISLKRVATEGFQFVITEVNARYLVPASSETPIVVETTISSLKRISGVWSQRIVSPDGETVYLEAELKAGITNREGRPTKPPPWLTEGLGRLVHSAPTGND